MDVCKVYDNRVIGLAWQYNGDIESAPDWAKQSSYGSIKQCDDEIFFAINGGVEIPLNKGDWLIKSGKNGVISVYCDDGFSSLFTIIPEKEKKPAVKKYREIIKTVDAWQYTGELRLPVNKGDWLSLAINDVGEIPHIPGWVFNMILHNRLGYQMATGKEIFQMYNNLCWTTVEVGDWIVHYDDGTLLLLPDATFKASFEEIK